MGTAVLRFVLLTPYKEGENESMQAEAQFIQYGGDTNLLKQLFGGTALTDKIHKINILLKTQKIQYIQECTTLKTILQ